MQCWVDIILVTLQKLIERMSQRMPAVIKDKQAREVFKSTLLGRGVFRIKVFAYSFIQNGL